MKRAALILLVAATSCHRGPAPILLFDGAGTSPGDVAALQAILRRESLDYSRGGLNGITAAELRSYRLVIIPGGNFVQIGNALTPATVATLRDGIREGVNYLGVCAGAFFAGDSPYNGLNLTGGVRFPFYSAEERGLRKAVVSIATPGGPTLEHYWEDGPQLTGWGEVAARYPDGTPAVVQGRFGAGWVVLTGTHPEAPETWRRGMAFSTPAADTQAYAAALIRAALNRAPLPGFGEAIPRPK